MTEGKEIEGFECPTCKSRDIILGLVYVERIDRGKNCINFYALCRDCNREGIATLKVTKINWEAEG